MVTPYAKFLESKLHRMRITGFEPLWMLDALFPFQAKLVDWAIRKGRGALFEDCGLGKSIQSLVWAENIIRKTNKPVLILAPLAVSHQFVREGEKFGIEVHDARTGKVKKGINVVNYQRMHYFDPAVFGGIYNDESSCVKHFDSKRRASLTEFVRPIKYRLLGTATPAPNDYMELGSSSEVLGEMKRNQMLGMFFTHCGEETQQWELKGHARRAYWRWMASWSRAIRKPSDLGFDDDGFILPPLNVCLDEIKSEWYGHGFGLRNFARTLEEQRKERKATLEVRCERVAELVPRDRPVIVWCHLNDEGKLLSKLIPDAVEVAGCHDDDLKEERMTAFTNGQIRVLVTKPSIAGFGMNWQHCADVFCFPSHSFESYYQLVRRCWRFGQKNRVNVTLVATERERLVTENMMKKEKQSVQLFDGIISEMSDFQVEREVDSNGQVKMRIPSWLRRL